MHQWKARHIKAKPWKVGETPCDVRANHQHLRRTQSPEAQDRYRASIQNQVLAWGYARLTVRQPAQVVEEEPSLCGQVDALEAEMKGATLEQLLLDAEQEGDAILEEQVLTVRGVL